MLTFIANKLNNEVNYETYKSSRNGLPTRTDK